jgi:uncharacterized protein
LSIFLTTFFLLYSGMHFYMFLKLRYAFPFEIRTGLCITAFMLVMIFAPVIVRMTEKAGHENFARFMAHSGYTWMAILFLFFSISVCIDFFRLCIYLSGLILEKDFLRIINAYRYFFIIPFLCSSFIASYGYYEAKQIRVERIIIKTSKISQEKESMKIAQISDVHLGLLVGEERLRAILNVVKKANPDIIVSTGDMVDGQINRLNNLAELLKEINPPYGKFAVTGNHEFYAGIKNALDFTEKTGFRMLRGEWLTVAGLINIAGVDDIAGKPYNVYKDILEKDLLSGIPREKFTLLLKHRPVVDPNAIGLFDLQLSGHTHKGQIFPFRYITRLFFPMYTGYFNLGNNSNLYASRGSGTWGPPIRFLTPPEVTIIELKHINR